MQIRAATEYFVATETVRKNKERYAQAEAAAPRKESRPPWFNVMQAMAGQMDPMSGEVTQFISGPGWQQ